VKAAMPIYEFACPQCRTFFQKSIDKTPTFCFSQPRIVMVMGYGGSGFNSESHRKKRNRAIVQAIAARSGQRIPVQRPRQRGHEKKI
jgi:hypothetical protein